MSDDPRIGLGLHFGYPGCCVRDFVDRSDRPPAGQDRGPWIGTGYIPCAAHALTAAADWDGFVRDVITPARACKQPFPHSRPVFNCCGMLP